MMHMRAASSGYFDSATCSAASMSSSIAPPAAW
jgi:hypothetical protein